MQCYLVGGAVRDRLLGYPYSERDWVVVGATPQQMVDAGFVPVGRDFPVFLHPRTHEEYALARTERKSGRGYHGFNVYAAPSVTLEEDLARRDLTINAIAEASDGRLIDPYGGKRDIDQRLLRHVSPAFVEDPLRVLRVARFASRYAHLGFRVAPETQQLMSEITASGELEYLAAERVWKELERALGERSPQVFFQQLRLCGALDIWMPELQKVSDTTWQTLAEAAATCSEKISDAGDDGTAAADTSTAVRFGLLASDLDPEAVESLAQRLKMPNDVRDLARLAAKFSEIAAHAAPCFRIDGAEGNDRQDKGQTLHALSPEAAATVLQILETADSWRRPERLRSLLSILARSERYRPWVALLQTAHQRCSAIDHRALMAQGLSGKAIGDALRQRRLDAIEELLRGTAVRESSMRGTSVRGTTE